MSREKERRIKCDLCDKWFAEYLLEHIRGTNLHFCFPCFLYLFTDVPELQKEMKTWIHKNFPHGVSGTPEVMRAIAEKSGESDYEELKYVAKRSDESVDIHRSYRMAVERKKAQEKRDVTLAHVTKFEEAHKDAPKLFHPIPALTPEQMLRMAEEGYGWEPLEALWVTRKVVNEETEGGARKFMHVIWLDELYPDTATTLRVESSSPSLSFAPSSPSHSLEKQAMTDAGFVVEDIEQSSSPSGQSLMDQIFQKPTRSGTDTSKRKDTISPEKQAMIDAGFIIEDR